MLEKLKRLLGMKGLITEIDAGEFLLVTDSETAAKIVNGIQKDVININVKENEGKFNKRLIIKS